MDARVGRESLAFGGFRFEPATGRLLRQGAAGDWMPVPIGSRALEILAVLLSRSPGTVVSKDTIMGAVWSGISVEPNKPDRADDDTAPSAGRGPRWGELHSNRGGTWLSVRASGHARRRRGTAVDAGGCQQACAGSANQFRFGIRRTAAWTETDHLDRNGAPGRDPGSPGLARPFFSISCGRAAAPFDGRIALREHERRSQGRLSGGRRYRRSHQRPLAHSGCLRHCDRHRLFLPRQDRRHPPDRFRSRRAFRNKRQRPSARPDTAPGCAACVDWKPTRCSGPTGSTKR